MVGRNHSNNSKEQHVQKWNIMQEQDVHDHEQHEKEQPCSSFEEASTLSNGSTSSSLGCSSSSSSSLDTLDDACSSSAHSSRSSLYDLSDLMAHLRHLPIKRGLSKFYHGKSDSFTSLAKVTSIEDLPKEKVPYKKMKKSYISHTSPKPIISKKKSKRKQFGSSIKKDL